MQLRFARRLCLRLTTASAPQCRRNATSGFTSALRFTRLWRHYWAGLSAVETALIALCVAAVLALELVNSAVERAVDKPDTTHWWSCRGRQGYGGRSSTGDGHRHGHCGRLPVLGRGWARCGLHFTAALDTPGVAFCSRC